MDDRHVQLIGTRASWRKLPKSIREAVRVEGVRRLKRVREAIASDANLPMPPVQVEPWAWELPQHDGAIYGKASPLPMRNGAFQWGVKLPASSLIVFDDDPSLRRVLCHEFAHCFWWERRIIEGADESGRIEIEDESARKGDAEAFETQIAKDESELVPPQSWFGSWDAEHFLFRCDYADQSDNVALRERWLDLGLPSRVPTIRFKVTGQIQIPGEIAERVQQVGGDLPP